MKNKGITLISLIVTIVVLIIIAGVALNIALGENGIFTKAKLAADTYKSAAKNEAMELNETYKILQELTGDFYVPEGFGLIQDPANPDTVIIQDENENEFVWIPVPNPVAELEEGLTETQILTELRALAAAGTYPMAVKTSGQDRFGRDNYRGVLYDFGINGDGTAVTVTPRSYVADSGYREPANLEGTTTIDEVEYVNDSQEMFTKQNAGTYSSTMYQEEFNELVESVIKNKGFYIGRYESGNMNTGTAVSKKDATGIASVNWYKMYTSQKNIYGNESETKTHMIWGSQFDQVLIYLKDIPNTNENVTNGKPFYVLNSIDMGVYSNNSSTYWNGHAGKFNVGGIYDIDGNVWDRTMEAYSTTYRSRRGRKLQQRCSCLPSE